jgi:two-component system response regulator FixJ
MPRKRGPVLIVDDDAAVRSALKFALELEGLEVCLYDSASALLEDKNLRSEGCLVIDYVMPEMSGLRLVEELRARQVQLPAILITGRADFSLRERAYKAGFSQILEKPLSGSALIESIRTALGEVGAFADKPPQSGR